MSSFVKIFLWLSISLRSLSLAHKTLSPPLDWNPPTWSSLITYLKFPEGVMLSHDPVTVHMMLPYPECHSQNS